MATNTLKTIAFPFQRGTQSFPKMVEDDVAVQAQFTNLVLTGKTERVNRPDIGLNAYAMVFATVTPIMRAQLAAEIAQQAQRNVPKAQVNGIDVFEANDKDGAKVIYVNIGYAVAGQQVSQQIPITGP